MNSTFAWSAALAFGVVFAAGCGGEGSGTTGAPAGTTSMADSATGTGSATATASASASDSASAATSATASDTSSASASGTASASAAPTSSASGTAVVAAKKFDCGEKGQKSCPMQGWMKSAMGSAVASGDAERLARAFETVARKPVAGFGNWVGIALEGAAKAHAGDIDAAKLSCKKCHDAYKYKYVTTMRDQAW